LFHDDTASVLAVHELRAAARHEVERSSLICRAAAGEWAAAAALHRGFWYFVREFEFAIDKHADVIAGSRQMLREKYGEANVRRVFAGLHRVVRKMKEEEGSHAEHWREDAKGLRIHDLDASPIVTGVRELVESAYTRELPRFFSVLAGTELIAEELSRYLVGQPGFTRLFIGMHWVWGEIHLEPHEDGPSPLDIDLDLARAFTPEDGAEHIFEMVHETIRQFGKAARDVETLFCPAAEYPVGARRSVSLVPAPQSISSAASSNAPQTAPPRDPTAPSR
jgi:hypothetical protein